ncbi:MAG: hypothetical protein AAF401_04655 [Pseudomonadota bacterium]
MKSLIALALALSATLAVAEPRRLTGDEIAAALSGKTAVGEWYGTPYKQYFSDKGWTVYRAENSRPEDGNWRADRDRDLYESYWRRSGWSGYQVLIEGDLYFWLEPSGQPQSFTLIDGNQM